MIFFVSGRATVSSLDALRFPRFEGSRTGMLEGIVKDCPDESLASKQDFLTRSWGMSCDHSSRGRGMEGFKAARYFFSHKVLVLVVSEVLRCIS